MIIALTAKAKHKTQIIRTKKFKIFSTILFGYPSLEKAEAILLFLEPQGSFKSLKKSKSLMILKLAFAMTISKISSRMPNKSGTKSKQKVDR